MTFLLWNTIDVERFAGLNIYGFSPIKVFAEILLCCLGHNCSLFSAIKERCLYSPKNFHGTLENRENANFLPSKSFHVYGSLLSYSVTDVSCSWQSWGCGIFGGPTGFSSICPHTLEFIVIVVVVIVIAVVFVIDIFVVQ